MVSVVLVVVSEVMLFVSILWSVVLFLVAHSVYNTTGYTSIDTTTYIEDVVVYITTLIPTEHCLVVVTYYYTLHYIQLHT